MRRSRAATLAAIGAVATLVLAACGGGGGGGGDDASEGGALADCKADPNACNAVPADQLQQGGTITFASEKNIANWNLLSAEGNTVDYAWALKGLLPYTFITQPDLKLAMNENVFSSIEQTSTEPQTIVYTIKPEAKWADGTPIGVEDFLFNWKIQNGQDCPDCAAATTSGYSQVESITGSDGGKTVTVVFGTPFTDWKNLWSSGSPMYPAHIAAQQGDLNTPDGLLAAFDYLGATVPTYTGGPYKIEKWEDNVALTTVPNPNWYGAAKPTLDKIVFRIITDATQAPIALQNNEVQVIYPQPQVDLVQQVKNIPGVTQAQGLGLTWEHFDLNLDNPFLADEAIRDAMFTAVNRQDIIDKTVGQFNDEVGPMNSHMFVNNQPGYQDVVTESGHGGGDVEAARKILTDAGYTGAQEGQQLTTPDGQAVAPMRIRYTAGNAIRQNECELFANAMRPLGLTVNVEPTDDLGGTLQSGDFDIMVFAWVSSPFPFANAQQNWLTGSASNYGNYSNPEVDRLLNEAASSTDEQAATAKLVEADKLLSEDAYVLPLYQKPTFLAVQESIANVRINSSLDGPAYNIAEWGLRSDE